MESLPGQAAYARRRIILNELIVTAITNFILAGETLFLAGLMMAQPKERYSAAWYWSVAMLLVGVASLIGGIDHGLFETLSLPRYLIQRLTWMAIVVLTFAVLMTTATQCFPAWLLKFTLAFGVAQFLASTLAILIIDDFAVVVASYGPVILLWLVMNLLGLRNGTGSMEMVLGTLLLLLGTGVQLSGFDRFSPLDHNGLYHLIDMVAFAVLYLGSRHLRKLR